MQKDFRRLLEEYLELKKRGVRDSLVEKEFVKRHCLCFKNRLGRTRPTWLFGYPGSTKDLEFWKYVDEAAAEAFVSFDTEDVIYPHSGKSLFQRLIDEGSSGSRIEQILYYGGFFIRGKRCESAAVIFLQKKRFAEWRASEISSGARSENEPARRIAREDEHPERQRANAYVNLRRALKDFPVFLLATPEEEAKKERVYEFSELAGSVPVTARRRGLESWKNRTFQIGFAEISKEQALLEAPMLELREAKSYKHQIQTLLEAAGFPLREPDLIKKIIAETKPSLPQIVDLEHTVLVAKASSDTPLLDAEIAREAREFFASLTAEEQQIQTLRYQDEKMTPFEEIGKTLHPERSGEHCRMGDRNIRERMLALFVRNGYDPSREKMQNFLRFFLEEMQDYNLYRNEH